MTPADTNRPVLAYSFEVKRRMLRVRAQQLIIVASKLLKFGREFIEVPPEAV